MLRIGMFSKLSRISIRMLRHYDESGLLTPKNVDPFTGYRYYDEAQLMDAARIVSLRDMGFGLAAIGQILGCYGDAENLAGLLSLRLTEVTAEIEDASRRRLLLESAIENLRKDTKTMNYNVTLKTIPQRYVVSTRMTIPSYDQEGMLWQTIASETAGMNIQMDENCLSMAIFHDKDYKESDVDVEIQCTVKGKYQDTENVRFKTVPQVTVASATYKGSYNQLTEVNHIIAQWVRDNKYQFSGPMFCIYHISPAQTQNPDEYVTEVCYPIEKQ